MLQQLALAQNSCANDHNYVGNIFYRWRPTTYHSVITVCVVFRWTDMWSHSLLFQIELDKHSYPSLLPRLSQLRSGRAWERGYSYPTNVVLITLQDINNLSRYTGTQGCAALFLRPQVARHRKDTWRKKNFAGKWLPVYSCFHLLQFFTLSQAVSFCFCG